MEPYHRMTGYSDISKIEVADKKLIVPPITIYWKDGSVQEVTIHGKHLADYAARRIADIALPYGDTDEIATLRKDIEKLLGVGNEAV